MKKPSAKQVNDAVRLLVNMTNNDLILLSDEIQNIYLVTLVHTKESAKGSRDNGNRGVREGTVEYMVSDGLPGERSMSFDFFNFHEAEKMYKELVRIGWKEYAKRYHKSSLQMMGKVD